MILHKRRRRASEFRLAQGLEVPLCSRVAARLGSRRVVVVDERGLPVIRLRQPLQAQTATAAPLLFQSVAQRPERAMEAEGDRRAAGDCAPQCEAKQALPFYRPWCDGGVQSGPLQGWTLAILSLIPSRQAERARSSAAKAPHPEVSHTRRHRCSLAAWPALWWPPECQGGWRYYRHRRGANV